MSKRLSPEDRRAQILEAVVPAILARGVEVTSRELAEAAGVAEGTLYRVFNDKEQLLLAVLDREANVPLRLPEPDVAERSLEAFIVESLRAFVAKFERLSAITLALGSLATRGGDEWVAQLERLYDVVAARFDRYRERLRISPTAAAEMLVTLAFTTAADWPGHTRRASHDDVALVLVNGLVLNPGAPSPGDAAGRGLDASLRERPSRHTLAAPAAHP